MNPTQEQIKEFWEGCGWEWWEKGEIWCYGGEMRCINLPPIDLNSLFGYAVPKLDAITMGFQYGFEANWRVKKKGTWYYAKDLDPALALFWAIYEVTK